MSHLQQADAAECARSLHQAGTYGGGYAFAGEEPVLITVPADDWTQQAYWDKLMAPARARQRALAEQRARLVAESLVLFATVKTRDEVRNGWIGQLMSAEAELQGLDCTQRSGRWTWAEYAAICEPARKRIAEAQMALLEIAP